MKITIVCLLALLCLTSCMRIFALDGFLFDPTRVDEYLKPEDLRKWGVRFIIPDSLIEPVVLTSMGNKIYGFFVKGDPDSTANNEVTILYCEGKDENLNRYWVRVEYLWEMGYSVFIFDYQGYGKSEGEPSGDALFSDGRQSLEYLQSRTDVDASKMVFFGFSLGTFVATYLAADIHHPPGLILESTPASVTALLHDSGLINLPGEYVADADFDNERRIADIQCPLFMMHGRADDFVVFDRHVPPVWNRAKEPKENLWVQYGGHSDIPEVLGNRYHKKINSFVSRYVLGD
ncbi:alpha/beta hydrolase [candidate division TA06 bacterium]|uniref:Alpha/beta hydrolase n=1 Tax=candidate division TA06 bacterium TaxID=2250710 RepID=A0A523UUU3_UNCT6|nr:MAG: alpha/beta hydrolase [candidate division TA06 bacterium]